MRRSICFLWLASSSLATLQYSCGAELTSKEAESALIHQVLEDQNVGKEVDRRLQLQSSISRESQDIAHWLSGDVKIDKEWMPLELYQNQGRSALADYTALRDKTELDLAGNRLLANWCERKGLPDQARAHWHAVVSASPNEIDARDKLGHLFIFDRWFSEEELSFAEGLTLARFESIEKWRAKLRTLTAALASESSTRKLKAIETLESISDPTIVPALENLVLLLDSASRPVLVKVISKHRTPLAAVSLANIALQSNNVSIRNTATNELKSYPFETYIPQLLNCLPPSVDLQTSQQTTAAGELLIIRTFTSAGSNTQRRSEHATLTRLAPIEITAVRALTYFPARGRGVSFSAQGAPMSTPRFGRDTIGDGYADYAQEKHAAIEQSRQLERNFALDEATATELALPYYQLLQTTTNLTLPNRQQAWHTWWQEYNQRHSSGISRESSSHYQVSQAKPIGHIAVQFFIDTSCLVKGTTVQTDAGPKAIETIKVGDMVASQNAFTGEIAFKPVLQTTIRPPEKTYSIVTKDETIQATGGHRWWVAGKGWLMTNQLEKGMTLYAASRTIRIEDVKQDEEAQPTYNLVVDKFHTYFVGKNLLLSYDNSPPMSVMASAPGFGLQLTKKD